MKDFLTSGRKNRQCHPSSGFLIVYVQPQRQGAGRGPLTESPPCATHSGTRRWPFTGVTARAARCGYHSLWRKTQITRFNLFCCFILKSRNYSFELKFQGVLIKSSVSISLLFSIQKNWTFSTVPFQRKTHSCYSLSILRLPGAMVDE